MWRKSVSARWRRCRARGSRFARNSRDWQQLIEMCRVVDTVLSITRRSTRLVMATIGFCSASKAVSTSMSLTCCGSVRSPPLRERPPANSCQRACWLRQGGRSLREDRTARAGGHQPGLRQSPGARQRTTGSALVLEHNLDLPVKGKDGETTWRRPNYATIHRMIENPSTVAPMLW